MQLWHLYSSLLGLGWAYQFSITDHGNLLHRYENGPPAASRILQTLLPCSSSFWCKWEAALQVQRGGGEPGEMQLREFFVRPDVNLKCSQGWKQNSMSAPVTEASSIDAPSATQRRRGLLHQTSRTFPPPRAGPQIYTVKSCCSRGEPTPDEARGCVIKLFWWVEEESPSVGLRGLTATGSSLAGSSECMEPVYMVACGWD